MEVNVMIKKSKVIITFIVSFIIAFFIVGYVKNTILEDICWNVDATGWDKFREYYIRTFSTNIIPALVIAVVPTGIIGFINWKKHKKS